MLIKSINCNNKCLKATSVMCHTIERSLTVYSIPVLAVGFG